MLPLQFEPRNASLFVYVENADESFEAAKANGATVLMELSNQDYGRTCGITDPTGNIWWITSVNKTLVISQKIVFLILKLKMFISIMDHCYKGSASI